jgi:hypothetical protein
VTAVGTVIRERSAPLVISNPTDTGRLFIAGGADRGPTDVPVLITSMAEFEAKFGVWQNWSSLWDVMDISFRNGLRQAYVGRVVGPTPTVATATVNDGTAASSLIFTARGPGVWYSGLNVVVQTTTDDASIQAGQYRVLITHDTDGLLEQSPIFSTQAEAVTYFGESNYVKVTLGVGTAVPVRVVSPGTSFSAATDDHTNINDTTRLAALNLFSYDLGAGQVMFSDATSSTAHGQLLDHAANNRRWGLLSVPRGTAKTGFMAAASALRTHANAKKGMLMAPWIKAPGTTPGTIRWVQPAAVAAGIIALNDGNGISPNQPSAGDYGVASFALDVEASFAVSQDMSDLNEAGVNMFVIKNGGVRLYGYRTLASKLSQPNWWMAGNGRFYMLIAALAEQILEGYVLKQIDGDGRLAKRMEGELVGMLQPYQDGVTADGIPSLWSFRVDTTSVNTPTTAQNGELHALIELRMSPHAEVVILDIVKRQIAG